MNTFWKALGVVLVSLALWGCDGQPENRPLLRSGRKR